MNADAAIDMVKDLARGAGEILREHYRRPLHVAMKGRRDPVTEADIASEELILKGLGRHFPEHSVRAEESGHHRGSSEAVWYVDPLDGTVNFSRGHPFFAVSLALEQDGSLELGVTYAPVLDELFWAVRGEGCFRESKSGTERLHVSQRHSLEDSLVASGFAYRRNDTCQDNRANVHRLIPKVTGFRRGGSASLDLAYVAAGHFDGFFELWLKPHDVAAGILFVLESGGEVSDYSGGGWDLFAGNLIASNGLIHKKLEETLDPYSPESFL